MAKVELKRPIVEEISLQIWKALPVLFWLTTAV